MIESSIRQQLAELNQKLLIAKAELDAEHFGSLLNEVERIKFGFDGRYNATPRIFVTSVFSEDGESTVRNVASDENIVGGGGKKSWPGFSRMRGFLRRLLSLKWQRI
jgi:hypothetical protein